MTDRSRVVAGSRMEPGAEDLQAELSDEHWLLIADLFANPEPSPKGGRPQAKPPRSPASIKSHETFSVCRQFLYCSTFSIECQSTRMAQHLLPTRKSHADRRGSLH